MQLTQSGRLFQLWAKTSPEETSLSIHRLKLTQPRLAGLGVSLICRVHGPSLTGQWALGKDPRALLLIEVIQPLYYLLNMSFDGDGPAGLAWNISWVNCPFKWTTSLIKDLMPSAIQLWLPLDMRFHYCLEPSVQGEWDWPVVRVCVCVCVCESVCVVIAYRHLLRANCGLRAQAGGQHLTLAIGCMASSSTLPCSAQEDFVTTSHLKWGVYVCVCKRERERRGGLIRSQLG